MTTDGTDPRPLALHVDHLGDGRYELGDVLGAGGMGIVRRARDVVLHREVAIKLLADNLASDDVARERFLREARAAARIDDAYVVPVYDVGDEAGRPYLVMPLIAGPTMAKVADNGGLDPDQLTAVASDALRGLAAAHRAGVLHRDVKPGNLLRGSDGRVLLTDLGVAEAAEAPGLTNTGFVIGTRAYLAPERLRGEPASVASDLYALGATLRELRAEGPDGGPVDLLIQALLAADPAARPADADAARSLLHEATTAERHLDAPGADAMAVAPGATRPLPVEDEVADGREVPTEQLTPASSRSGNGRWTAVAVVAAAVVLVAVTVSGRGSDPPPTVEPLDAEVVDAEVADGDTDGDATPSERARALAERLRERAGE